MARRKRSKEKGRMEDKGADKSFKIILAGLLIIVLISFSEGFGPTFTHMIFHLQQDFQEWAIHLYILGWILVIYGFYRLIKQK